jgi:hypothetical protein
MGATTAATATARERKVAAYSPENLHDNRFGYGFVYNDPTKETERKRWYDDYEWAHGEADDWFSGWGYLDRGYGQIGSAQRDDG